jgi:hypothetical protein
MLGTEPKENITASFHNLHHSLSTFDSGYVTHVAEAASLNNMKYDISK